MAMPPTGPVTSAYLSTASTPSGPPICTMANFLRTTMPAYLGLLPSFQSALCKTCPCQQGDFSRHRDMWPRCFADLQKHVLVNAPPGQAA